MLEIDCKEWILQNVSAIDSSTSVPGCCGDDSDFETSPKLRWCTFCASVRELTVAIFKRHHNHAVFAQEEASLLMRL